MCDECVVNDCESVMNMYIFIYIYIHIHIYEVVRNRCVCIMNDEICLMNVVNSGWI